MTDQLKGEALDEALREAGLPTGGSADEKRARLAEHQEATGAGTGGGEQPDQSNENPKAFEADPHVHVPGNPESALRGPGQDDLNPAYAPPPQPDGNEQGGDQGSQ